MSTHTPLNIKGPLRVEWVPWGDQRDLKIVDAHGVVCTMNTRGLTGDAHMEAIARVFAAAPYLLASLEETLRALETHLDESCRDHGLGNRDLLCPCHENEVARARALIARATGKDGRS